MCVLPCCFILMLLYFLSNCSFVGLCGFGLFMVQFLELKQLYTGGKLSDNVLVLIYGE